MAILSDGFATYSLPTWYIRSLVRRPTVWRKLAGRTRACCCRRRSTWSRRRSSPRPKRRRRSSVTAVEDWPPPPPGPALGEDEVAVWRLGTAAPRPIETVLARYLAVEPGSLTLGRTPAGKPELAGAPFRVSLAHGGGVALVAVTDGREVGVDVEPVRPVSGGWSLVAPRAHAGRAPAARAGSDRAAGMRVLVDHWTRKEALLKAAGVGLAVDPVLVEALDGASVRAVPPTLGSARGWTLVDIPLNGHLAAVAVRGRISRLNLYAVS